MDKEKERIDNTFDIVEKVLGKNRDNKNVKEAYDELIKLKETRSRKE